MTISPILNIFVDNSRRSVAEKCLRKRYYNYEYRGQGIEPIHKGKSEFPLLTGTGVHNSVEGQLRGEAFYQNPYHSFDCGGDERLEYLVKEQEALIDGLGYVWQHVKNDAFLAAYEVLDIEREESVELAPRVVWMSRPDLFVRRRSDGALFIVNLKTTKKADERWVSQWPLDAQTLSEVVAVEDRINSQVEHYGQVDDGHAVKLSGVIILGLLKGEQLQYPLSSGNWYHNSPLIWAWHNESGKVHPRGEWSARYEWHDDEGGHRLGKGWVKREIWLHYPGGVKAWVEHLASSDPALLEEQVVELPPLLRSEQQINEWKQTVIAGERDIRERREEAMFNLTLHPNDNPLASPFPMSTSSGNCLWPSKCQFFDLCHSNGDPDDAERYVPRIPNHPGEVFE